MTDEHRAALLHVLKTTGDMLRTDREAAILHAEALIAECDAAIARAEKAEAELVTAKHDTAETLAALVRAEAERDRALAWIDALECPHAVDCATYKEIGVDCDCGLAALADEPKGGEGQ